MGLTLASERLTRKQVEAGELMPVLVNVVGLETPVTLVWPSTEFINPKVRAFIDLTVDMIREMVRLRDEESAASLAQGDQ